MSDQSSGLDNLCKECVEFGVRNTEYGTKGYLL